MNEHSILFVVLWGLQISPLSKSRGDIGIYIVAPTEVNPGFFSPFAHDL